MNTPIMPMPGLQNSSGADVVASPSVHSSPVPAVQAAGSVDVNDLSVPEHVKPTIQTFENQNSSIVALKPIPAQGIEVMATRKGFYNQERIAENKKFFVRKISELGDWMICLDPDFEAERRKLLKEKLEKAKAKK